MKKESTRWAIHIRRKDTFTENEKIMQDVDWNDNSNHTARRSNDAGWINCPVILMGSYVSGRAADHSDVPLPEGLSDYHPWELVLSEEEKKGKSEAKRVKKSADATSSQNDRMEPSGAKTKVRTKTKATRTHSSSPPSNLAKRRREFYNSSSSSESDDDDSSPSEDSIKSSMSQLSTLFFDSMTAMGNDEFQHSFDMVSKICDNPCLDDPSLRRASILLNPSFKFAFGSQVISILL
ncbi:uncharacterized protein LOC113329853 [Papaver somniferum]|uniref:uncharacterized protein LOC113329853 n=1 Tax=Papaver somniferum TaxID=3469 RepID=UPI000E6FD438|nr:uncharacterized protein LOC113329853 [Papaver somniferum]